MDERFGWSAHFFISLPAGSPSPSSHLASRRDAPSAQADKTLTTTLVQALRLVDVRVLDHLIVGGDTILSFAEHGLM